MTMSEMRRKYVETTANNRVVSVDVEKSHAATHLEEQAKFSLWELSKEALRKVSVTEDDVAIQVDMGRVVGEMDLVETDPLEPRIYGRRRNRNSYIPFVVRDERSMTSFVVVILKKLALERLHAESPEPKLLDPELLKLPQHDLFSTYVGETTPGLPGGDPKYITDESISFWMSHALILGSQVIDETYEGEGVPPEYREKRRSS
jgi:hypothetical protein